MVKNKSKPNMASGGASSSVYGMGFIGAVIYFIQQADSFWEGVVGIAKAIIWPAMVVYKWLQFFSL